MRIALLTGGTGFLGSHFILNAMDVLYDKFIVIIRGKSHELRQFKLEKALITASESYQQSFDIKSCLEKCLIIEGDISLTDCGLELVRTHALLNNQAFDFWHFAAVLDFEDKHAARVNTLNIEGTEKVLLLAKKLEPVQFFYISTAYSCGALDGFIKEELHSMDRPFSNVYERSKCYAEHQVITFCNQENITWTLLRPSIVIGNSQTKKPGGASTGLYNFIAQLSGLNKVARHTKEKIRIYGNPEAVPNIIPVDIAIQEFIHIAQDSSNRKNIFHVTSYSSPHVQFFVEEITRQLGSKNTTVANFNTEQSSPLEKFTAKHISIYSNYFKKVQVFENKRKLQCHVNALDTMSYIAEGIKEIHQESAFHVFQRQTIFHPNIDPLVVYTAGKQTNPAILLINAHGMPVQFLSPLAKKLSQSYFVLTWETRIPSKLAAGEVVDNAYHLQDMLAILDHFHIANTDVIGWCTGASLALVLAINNSKRTKKLVLLSGSFVVKDLVDEEISYTEFQNNMLTLMPQIANDMDFAKLMHSVLFKENIKLKNMQEKELSNAVDSLLTAVDPAIMHLTNKPFETPKALQYHARLINGHIQTFPRNFHIVQNEALVLIGKDDNTSSIDTNRVTARLIQNSAFKVINAGGHFMIYDSSEYMQDIFNFLLIETEEKIYAV